MSQNQDTYADLTQQTISTMATELERLAERLRLYGSGLTDSKRSAVGVVSEIVTEYTSRTGSIGGRLGDVIRNAVYIDKYER